jgi:hypothetical protein
MKRLVQIPPETAKDLKKVNQTVSFAKIQNAFEMNSMRTGL